jgi:hypothetical protein
MKRQRYQKFFKEAKQIGKIYHYTSIESLEDILKTNRLGLTIEEQKDLEKKYLNYIYSLPGDFNSRASLLPLPQANKVYFSRTPNNKVFKNQGVLLVLDGDKLSNNYKIVDIGGIYYGKIENELHIPRIINNIKKYIIQIIIKKEALDTFGHGYGVIQDKEGRVIGVDDSFEKFKKFLKKNNAIIK